MRISDLKFGLIFLATSLIVKLPYLGTFLTIDERRWINGAGQFLLALRSGNLAQTYWHFHPGITITWGEALILWLQSLWATNQTLEAFVQFQTDHLELSVGAMRLSGVILTSLVLPFIYAIVRPQVGKWPALLGVGLLAVDPFWVAHSRIVNGDALTGVLMPASFLCFALLLTKPRQKWAIVAGIFAGLSFLTKLPSQILIPLILLLAIIGYFRDRNWRFWLKALILCGLSSAIVFIILWPAMWIAPLKTLTLIYEDIFAVGDIGGKDKVEFFMGQVVEQQSLLFYLPALLFRLTPVSLMGLLLSLPLIVTSKEKVGYKANVPTLPQSKTDNLTGYPIRGTTILLWLFVIIVVIFANISPKKSDRYVMSAVVAIDLLAGVGWIWLLEQINKWANGRIATNLNVFTIYNLLVGALIATQLIFTITSYPYVLTYYNPLLGGYAKAAELIPVGRGEGLEQAAAWINAQPDAQQATITPYYENVTNYYLTGTSLDWPKDGKKQILADYVVFYITQTQRQIPYSGLVTYFQEKIPAYVVSYGKTPYVWVYKREAPINPLAGEAEIIGRAQIAGYYQAETKLMPGSSTEIILYFLTSDQQLPENEDFRVSLVDIDGNEHGNWRSTAADNHWRPKAIVEWKGTLSLPMDMTAGDYKLKISLVDINLNSDVTFFPIEDEIITIQ